MAKQYGQHGYENRENRGRNRRVQPGGEGRDYGRTSEFSGGEGQGDYGQSDHQGGRSSSDRGQDFNDEPKEGGRSNYAYERGRSGYSQQYGPQGDQGNYQPRRQQGDGSGGRSNYSSNRYGGSDFASNDYARNASRDSTPYSQPSAQSDWERYTDEGYQANDGRSRLTNSHLDRLRGSGDWSNRSNGDFEQAYGRSYGSNENAPMISSSTDGDRYGQGEQQRFGQANGGGSRTSSPEQLGSVQPGSGQAGGFGAGQSGSSQVGSSQSGSEYYGNSQSGDAYGGGYGQSYRGIGPKGYERSDERIRELVCECLSEDHTIDACNILVEVKDKEVKLTGSVKDRRQKYAAEELIERKVGGVQVQNELRVKSEASEQNQSGANYANQSGSGQASSQPGQMSQPGARDSRISAQKEDAGMDKPKTN